MKPLTADELQHLHELHSKTTPGEWRSWIEGRDHQSGSDFIKTSGDDIELTGATHIDQDFIAMAHSCIPRLIKELKQYRETENNSKN